MINENEYIKRQELDELVRSGHQYTLIHEDGMVIEVPMSRMEIRQDDENGEVLRHLNLNDVSDALGALFKPVTVFGNHRLIHWCYDEKKMNGKTEQDYLKDLLLAYGFVNIRDLDADGVNDSEAKDINFEELMKEDVKYFGFFSALEVKHLVRANNTWNKEAF